MWHRYNVKRNQQVRLEIIKENYPFSTSYDVKWSFSNLQASVYNFQLYSSIYILLANLPFLYTTTIVVNCPERTPIAALFSFAKSPGVFVAKYLSPI